jgi:hypothetical protein
VLILSRNLKDEACEQRNCLVLDLPDGSRVRVWMLKKPGKSGRVRVAIDAPRSVLIRRGEHVGPDAESPNPN